ncbi:MAG: integrase [Mycobacterium sp.]|nr:integrase [Mycobacterium sp.]
MIPAARRGSATHRRASCRADALLLLRATGMSIGELIDLELDCVHEVPGAGAWIKTPLGKLDSERMVPSGGQLGEAHIHNMNGIAVSGAPAARHVGKPGAGRRTRARHRRHRRADFRPDAG